MPKRSKEHLQDAMATALSLDHWSPPKESICEYSVRELSVNFLCMDQTGESSPDGAPTSLLRAARFQEIFLDLVGWYTSRNSSSRYLLDDRFESILSEEDKDLKDKIFELMKSTKSKDSEAYTTLTSLLEQNFGF
jgi:hypothetical protein